MLINIQNFNKICFLIINARIIKKKFQKKIHQSKNIMPSTGFFFPKFKVFR